MKTILLTLLAIPLLQGCASIASHCDCLDIMSDRVDHKGKNPPPYHGTLDDLDFTWTCLIAPVYNRKENHGDWWLFFLFPLPIADSALSFPVDTVLLPADIYSYDPEKDEANAHYAIAKDPENEKDKNDKTQSGGKHKKKGKKAKSKAKPDEQAPTPDDQAQADRNDI